MYLSDKGKKVFQNIFYKTTCQKKKGLYICTRFKKHMSAFIPVNKIIIIFKDTSQ
jgi:hypothetical protein